MVVAPAQDSSAPNDGGWLARLARSVPDCANKRQEQSRVIASSGRQRSIAVNNYKLVVAFPNAPFAKSRGALRGSFFALGQHRAAGSGAGSLFVAHRLQRDGHRPGAGGGAGGERGGQRSHWSIW